jgi:hypothetical protein
MNNPGVKNTLYFSLIFTVDLNRLKELNALSALIELQEGNVERRMNSTIALRQFQFISILP